MRSWLLPLCSVDEVRAEIAELDLELDAMGAARVVDRDRFVEARGRKLERRGRLVEQLEEMEAAA